MDNTLKRTAQIYTNSEWLTINFADIKAGDHFRLLSPEGIAVDSWFREATEWVATEDAKDGEVAAIIFSKE